MDKESLLRGGGEGFEACPCVFVAFVELDTLIQQTLCFWSISSAREGYRRELGVVGVLKNLGYHFYW